MWQEGSEGSPPNLGPGTASVVNKAHGVHRVKTAALAEGEDRERALCREYQTPATPFQQTWHSATFSNISPTHHALRENR